MKRYKNIISCFLATCILISNIGLIISFHFCEGNFTSLTFFEINKNTNCCEDFCCEATDNNHALCCNSKEVFIKKTEIDYSQSEIVKFIFWTFADSFYPNELLGALLTSKVNEATKHYINSNAPPLFILYNSLIFYQ